MSTVNDAERSLAVRVTDPFQDDWMQRGEFAQALVRLIEERNDGWALWLDGEWGTGKTKFAGRLKDLLAQRGHGVSYFNAFDSDFAEDPFLPLAAALLSAVDDVEDSKKGSAAVLVQSAVKAGKALVPAMAAGATSQILKAVVGEAATEEVSEAIDGALRTGAEAFAANVLSEFQKSREAVESFESLLRDFGREHLQTDKRLVVIIDELDRCRPSFGVRTVERAKQLFATPGVVFVFVGNCHVLASTIQREYGLSDLSAETYLSKYIDLKLHLPGISRATSPGIVEAVVRACAADAGVAEDEQLIEALTDLVIAYEMSIRECQRILPLTLLYTASFEHPPPAYVCAVMAAIAFADPATPARTLKIGRNAVREELTRVFTSNDPRSCETQTNALHFLEQAAHWDHGNGRPPDDNPAVLHDFRAWLEKHSRMPKGDCLSFIHLGFQRMGYAGTPSARALPGD